MNAPVQAVFDLLAGPERAPEWSANVHSTQRLTPGPVRVGTETRSEVEVLGRRWSARGRCTIYDPPRRIAIETHLGPGLASRSDMQLEAEPDGTTLRAELAFRLPGGPLGVLVGSLVARGALESDFDESLRRLKDLAEHSYGMTHRPGRAGNGG